jgi:ferredoxin
MIRFAALLPLGEGTHALVASTRAGTKLGRWLISGMEGTAVYLIALILALRGYRVRGARGIDMPSNWLSLHSGFSESAARAIIARSRPHAQRFFTRILAGKRWYGSLICLAQGLLLAPVSLGYLIAGRFGLAKLFFASTRCDGCGVCAAICPRNAIRMTGGRKRRPYWTFDCESCMRCMAYCPQKAVEASHAFVYLLVQLPGYLLPAIAAVLANYTAQLSWTEPLTARWGLMLLRYPLLIATYWACYRIVHWLNFFPPVNLLVTWTTLTHFYRRSHEPDTKLAQLAVVGTRAFVGSTDTREQKAST